MHVTNTNNRLSVFNPIVLPDATKKLKISFYWNAIVIDGETFELDVSAVILNNDLKTNTASDIIFYNQRNTGHGVYHAGDNLLLVKNENAKTILHVDIDKLPDDTKEVRLILTINDAKNRNLDFTRIEKILMTFVDEDTNHEICYYSFNSKDVDFSACESVRLIKTENGWKLLPLEFCSDLNLQQIFEFYSRK